MTPAEPDSAAADKARARRNLALAAALIAFVVLVFFVTIVQLRRGLG